MAFSALDICSQALVKVGASPIHSFENNTVESRIANALYESTKQNLLSVFPWTFAIKTVRLAKLSEIPDTDFSFAFQLPHDFLRVVSAGKNNKSAGLDYQIKEEKLYTNSDEIHLNYISKILETDMPPFFIQALVSRLASEFCLPLTENTTLGNFLLKQATADEKKARLIDSQQETPRAILNFPIVDIRG